MDGYINLVNSLTIPLSKDPTSSAHEAIILALKISRFLTTSSISLFATYLRNSVSFHASSRTFFNKSKSHDSIASWIKSAQATSTFVILCNFATELKSNPYVVNFIMLSYSTSPNVLTFFLNVSRLWIDCS